MRKLLFVLFVLVFASPVFGLTLGCIDSSMINPGTLIEHIETNDPMLKSAAFRYGEEIKAVVAVISYNTYFRRFEYDSIRYLRDDKLHYVTWDINKNQYGHTEAPYELKASWIKQLKKYVDGV